MKTPLRLLGVILCTFHLIAGGFAEPPDARKTMAQLSASADQELARSIAELNQLRARIAAEKLPLAQELTTSEETLARLRGDYEKAARLVDAGNLELVTIKAEMKARQDELAYIGNLLDEYARAFESKVNVSELQYLGKALETAKQTTEDKTLSPVEKFDRQLAFANLSLQRLFDAIGGMRFAGVGVDMQGTVEDGQFAIIGPVGLFRAKNGATAGLALAQSGSTNPLIRPLEGPLWVGQRWTQYGAIRRSRNNSLPDTASTLKSSPASCPRRSNFWRKSDR